ncbi:hypothetical protein ASPSYDRAFT_669167 [Aspergillus sydowii CBS 593.65]|uniref:Uncharacterized protein n=1 Tax=Aspergillus sydowii CBS 593.65 TaxID=1036612 RepID=A0A1L9TTR9_9EURO|nr:uncharacterized protein ASPSYDRAFT_669167 [Aspergillus sydowii CBS 593.65]OJJ62802.1 hypothetical protein ASPSYDRAFT_669167 [Aspergillus sydowii CBS 593.65]
MLLTFHKTRSWLNEQRNEIPSASTTKKKERIPRICLVDGIYPFSSKICRDFLFEITVYSCMFYIISASHPLLSYDFD